MPPLAADSQDQYLSLRVVIIVALIAGVIYGFGYLRAVMHRANRDYKTTKAALPNLRKGFWRAWWKAVKIGALVFFAGMVMIIWVARDIEHAADAKPAPSSSTVSSHPPR